MAGFLDSGKTNFINGVLEDGFARQDRTLLLRCEEGEEEYNAQALDNVTVVDIEDEGDLTCSRMKELEKKYRPKQSFPAQRSGWSMTSTYHTPKSSSGMSTTGWPRSNGHSSPVR